jgi:Tfp pilus assembly protein PilO
MSVDKIIQIDSSHRRVLLAALVVVAAVGLYRWILAPYNGQLMAAQQYESTLDRVIHKADVLGTTREAKRAKVEELTRESVRLRNELFTPGEVRNFLASLPAVAQQAGCVIQSVSSGRGGSQNRPEDGSGIVSKGAVVTVTGGYGNIVRFLKELQTAEHKVWIESVKLGTGDNAGKLKCQVALTLYCIDSLETTLYE